MLTTIAKIFGRSPFSPLQFHMTKVEACINLLNELIVNNEKESLDKKKQIAKKISTLEHDADLTKNDIRNQLPSTLFLPIDKATLLEILSLQDSIADKAEDISIIFTLKKLENFDLLKEDFLLLFNKTLNCFALTKKIIDQLDCLLLSSFGGLEAQKTKELIDKVCIEEHEIDKIQYKLIEKLYNENITFDYKSFNLWTTIIKEIGNISNLSEKLANRIRMILEIK